MDALLNKAGNNPNRSRSNHNRASKNLQHCRSTFVLQHGSLLCELRACRHIPRNNHSWHHSALGKPSAGCSRSNVRRKPHTAHTCSHHRLHHRHDNQLRLSLPSRKTLRLKKNLPRNHRTSVKRLEQVGMDNLHSIRLNPRSTRGTARLHLRTPEDTSHNIHSTKLCTQTHNFHPSSLLRAVSRRLARRCLNQFYQHHTSYAQKNPGGTCA